MKKYLVVAALIFVEIAALIIIAILLFWYKNKQNQAATLKLNSIVQQAIIPPLATSQETLCKAGTFTTPSPNEISHNQSMSEDVYVQYVRTAINYYLNNDYSTGAKYNGLVDGVHNPDSAYTEFEAIDEDYLRSKFIVIATDTAPGGGEEIDLIFKDKPNQVFSASVNDYTDSTGHIHGFNLGDFSVYDSASNGALDMQTIQQAYINQICDPNFGT
jgi:hypothetical protein